MGTEYIKDAIHDDTTVIKKPQPVKKMKVIGLGGAGRKGTSHCNKPSGSVDLVKSGAIKR